MKKNLLTKTITLTPEDNASLANLCGEHNCNLKQIEKYLKVDISNRGHTFQIQGTKQALKEAVDGFGRVDFLLNYAGGAIKVAPIEEMDDEINQRIIDLNLTSTIMSCRTFTPQLKKQGFGKIINVSSACDRRSWPPNGHERPFQRSLHVGQPLAPDRNPGRRQLGWILGSSAQKGRVRPHYGAWAFGTPCILVDPR